MQSLLRCVLLAATLVVAACASPPSSNPSAVESACAQHCSSDLATCGSGFKLFPIVQQKQCNDAYDVCIGGCPSRAASSTLPNSASASAQERLKRLEELLKQGAITKEEYDAKRKEVLSTL